ncbi:MAG: DUF551 domain-containing protein [Flavobacteriales bacterium]|nr:DUF551 domain-containing protein [Flavobacteriales bacterium]
MNEDAGPWVPVKDRLPDDQQRVLCWIPGHRVYLPGKSGATELREAVILRFHQDFFVKNPSKTGKARGDHFWTGEGTSNHFFHEVTHWRPLPEGP